MVALINLNSVNRMYSKIYQINLFIEHIIYKIINLNGIYLVAKAKFKL